MFDKTSYMRLNDFPVQASSILKLQGIDISSFLDRWISIDQTQGLAPLGLAPILPSDQAASSSASQKNTTLSDLIPGFGKRAVILVSQIEKRD